ncbi:MAG: cell division protein FtsZ [Spirosomaceae bacterium]|jgi:cell division protein FtsZ|nr:cell division protein FtsZ [Spirosomataceae bacterium]
MHFARKNYFDHDYEFVMQEPNHSENAPIIKVIGVGGGGSNAVNHMFHKGIKDVVFVVTNTDKQALVRSPVSNKIQLGAEMLQGLGAGTDAEQGRLAAEESIEYIRQLMHPPTQMVFITAGMGGGTGTGAAPVIAKVAKDMGMLTVAVVTAPYGHEGKIKKKQAIDGINALKANCDTVLVILNDELAKLYGKLPILRAFEHADNVLTNAVKSIAEIITVHGSVNSDFMDVKKVLKEAGTSVMSSAIASGETRAELAIEAALNSPLLNNRDIRGAKRILITLSSSTEEEYQATLDEQMVITEYIESLIGDEADMCKVGVIFDDSLGDQLLVTVIAAGFEDSHLPFSYESVGNLKSAVPVSYPPVGSETVKEETKPTTPNETFNVPPTAVGVEVGKEVEELTATKNAPPVINLIQEQPKAPLEDAPLAVEPVQKKPVFENKPEPQEDPAILAGLVQDIVNGRYSYSELDKPAYLRQKVVLHQKPSLPDSAFIPITLDKHQK